MANQTMQYITGSLLQKQPMNAYFNVHYTHAVQASIRHRRKEEKDIDPDQNGTEFSQ